MQARGRGWIALVAAAALLACSDSPADPGPVELLTRYAAIGNSITAGYQSGGINDSTQRESYAYLLARQGRTRSAYASLAMPGCPPPIASILTGVRVGGGTEDTCAGRTPGSETQSLNNVAVPGATSADVLVRPDPDELAELILGDRSQAEHAIALDPTFVSVWIGNNDVLDAAVTGVVDPTSETASGITPVATFIANYAAMMTALNSPGRSGVLIGVVDVTRIPALFPATALGSQFLRTALETVAGTTVTIDPACLQSTARISAGIALAIRSGAHPATIRCTEDPVTGLGEEWVLEADEQVTISAAVAGYNAYISAKADSLGYAYYDPNPSFALLRANGSIPDVPNVLNTAQLFGEYFSLDGVHPSGKANLLIARELIAVINAHYGTSIPALP